MTRTHSAAKEAPASQTPTTLAELRRRLGSTLLVFDAPLPERPLPVEGVWLAEPGSTAAIPPGSLVLCPGQPRPGESGELFARLAAGGAAGVVLHSMARVGAQDETSAVARGLAVIRLAEGASWLQLAAMLQTLTAGSEIRTPAAGSPLGAEADLFDLANSLAVIIGGPVTIENLDSRILAFSSDQADADAARKLSVLGHQVPTKYSEIMRRDGTFRAIYDSATPVFVPSIGPGIRPRVVMRVRAGNQTLGSIWAVVNNPLNDHRSRALSEVADMVALSMLRARTAADAAGRLRYGLLVMLLEGGAAAEEAAARIGFAGNGAAVLAAGLLMADAGSAEGEAELDRIAGALNLHLKAVNPLSMAARVGGTIYGVLPVAGRKQTDPERQDTDTIRRVAEGLVSRLSRDDVAVGLGSVVAAPGQLNRSRSAADSALRVLLSPHSSAARTRVASGQELQIPALMMRLGDDLAASREELTGPLAALRDHDARHPGDLVRTLSAWLDSFGDVAAAAAVGHVHQNTFRYRFKKLCDVGGIDPGDAEQRFALMLQLRLFDLGTRH